MTGDVKADYTLAEPFDQQFAISLVVAEIGDDDRLATVVLVTQRERVDPCTAAQAERQFLKLPDGNQLRCKRTSSTGHHRRAVAASPDIMREQHRLREFENLPGDRFCHLLVQVPVERLACPPEGTP